MTFTPSHTDFTLSPFTGLTRESWLEAGRYLLSGIFSHLKSSDEPLVMPRAETEITYPHLHASQAQQERERKAEIFEGLTRSFFIASVLVHEEPSLTLSGISLKDYYKKHILRCCTRGDACFVGSYGDMQALLAEAGTHDPFRPFQQTVETCALVIGLWASKNEIWDSYTQSERDCIAAFLSDWAHAPTVPQNWRLFNMLDLAFLKNAGYKIDERIMIDHAQAILDYYAGGGWYRDGQSFDYYSCWAFNFYAPLWNLWYGYEHAPEIAVRFEGASNTLMQSYCNFFDRDGFVNMWGRSCIYRNAATSAFDGNLFLKHSVVNCGWARRISSGALLQFLSRDDFLCNKIPTLGFYRQFAPLVQGYSCAESPFWLGKAFLCLHLPPEHPFWTETENEGDWALLTAACGKESIKQTVLDGPALCFTNHGANGETVLRTGKIVKAADDLHGMWNYAKLSYNTKWPWEATPKPASPDAAEAPLTVEAQQYVLMDSMCTKPLYANATFWAGEKDGVLYRRQFFNYELHTETHWMQALNLADFAVPYGIIRADKLRLFRRPITLTLGAYGFPDNGTRIEKLTDGNAQALVLTGRDHTGCKKQLAFTVWSGWDSLEVIKSSGTNPDSENSIVAYAKADLHRQYDASEPYLFISQVITKESDEPFTKDEIFPIAHIGFSDRYQSGAYGSPRITLKDGSERLIDFSGIEGRLTL